VSFAHVGWTMVMEHIYRTRMVEVVKSELTNVVARESCGAVAARRLYA